MEGPTGGVSQPQSAEQHIRLACQACQRKKIKCDRNFPCGQCQRSSLQCSPSHRKPRARHAGKKAIDSELRSRITKLESLVETLSSEVSTQELKPDELSGSPTEGPNATTSSAMAEYKYLANPFWLTLASEVQALRDALNDDEGDEDEDASPGTQQSGASGAQSENEQFDLLICPPGSVFVLPGALQEPTPLMQTALYSIFFENVAPFQRYYHCPTLRAFLERGASYLGQSPNMPNGRLTKAAIWYSAVNTLTEDECVLRFGASRAELSSQYKKYVEILLSQVDLMCTTEMVTLQAFLTYMMTLRKDDHSRRVWTLTAVAVRLAYGMELHHETTNHTPFEVELRRRIWHGIRFLDTFAAHDRGTEIMTRAGSFDTPVPSNVNDHEWDETSTEIKGHPTGLTDSSFTLLTSDATLFTQRLNTAEICPIGMPWKQRLEIAEQFGATIHEKYIQFCDLSVPFHRLIYTVGKSMAASAILRAVRPMQRHVASVPPRVDSPYVLQIALDCLRESERVYDDPAIDKWRWLVWVPWHALAVCLAGLCSIRGTELSESAWPLVDSACRRHSQYIADTRSGMLWRPIEKLYRKAKAFREAGRRESQTSSQTSASPQPTTPQVQGTSLPASISPNEYLGYPPAMEHIAGYGSIPMAPIMTGSIGFGTPNLPDATTDIGWNDWEKIMDDFSTINPNMSGDMTVDLQQMSVNENGFPMMEQGKWNASGFGGMM